MKALVIKAKMRPHPNADKLAICDAMGYSVIVSKTVKDGDLLLFFETGTQLSPDFACAHKLTKELGGMFDHRRLVKSINLRGERSEGFAIEVGALAGAYKTDLQEGQELAEINGLEICRKYISPATRAVLDATPRPTGNRLVSWLAATFGFTRKKACPVLPEHLDTSHLRRVIKSIPTGSRLDVTEKLHGTSHRVGNVRVTSQRYRTGIHWLDGVLAYGPSTQSYQIVHGTRRTILTPTGSNKYNNGGHYGSHQFRLDATTGLSPRQGEVLYGEIVGWVGDKPIMPRHSTDDKAITKKWGPSITYSYGTQMGEAVFYVYRITQEGLGKRNGNSSLELSDWQMRERAREMGVSVVPHIFSMDYDGDHALLYKTLMKLADSPDGSRLDASHPIEGIVVRVTPPSSTSPYFVKQKSWTFSFLEGISLERGDLDTEDATKTEEADS